MGIEGVQGRWVVRGAAISASLIILAMCAVWAAPNATASSELPFDPALSLTGGCTPPTILDPVPDPSCPEGPLPAKGSFAKPTSIATDAYGNIYVASFGRAAGGTEGRIDIFDSSGRFLTELPEPDGPLNLAVDGAGNLYVVNSTDANELSRRVVRYSPNAPYNPATGEVTYGSPPSTILEKDSNSDLGIAVNVSDDHLFVYRGSSIIQFGSATEGNPKLEEFGQKAFKAPVTGVGLAIDTVRGRIYANGAIREEIVHGKEIEVVIRPVIRVFELSAPHNLLPDIDGSALPAGKFSNSNLTLAVNEGDGDLFVYDGEFSKLFELTDDGGYVETFEHGFQQTTHAQVEVDNGKNSENGGLNPRGRYVYIASNPTGVGHSYAFGPLGPPCEPEVASPGFSEVGETEAELQAMVNPCNLETSYVFEYVTQAQFEDAGFGGAQVAASGQLPAARMGTQVSASVEGLSADTVYRFRVVATNEAGSAEAEGSFSTYPAETSSAPESCPNAALRTGLSVPLPDCRAYELVTPPDTNLRTPLGLGKLGIGIFFSTREASPSGEQVSFRLEGGAIPGLGGTGSLDGDPYLSTRGATGWGTVYAGPPAPETPALVPGSHSSDQGYSFWANAGGGPSAVNGEYTTYVRYPDGHSALIGRGTLGTAPQALGDLISESGSHIIFDTAGSGGIVGGARLEPNSPPKGTSAVYDRTLDEVTHVVSLLPGDVTPNAGEHASYQGASFDGRGVAFKIGSTLYLRHDNVETYTVGKGVTFEGVAEGGSRAFYLEGGNLLRFDAQIESVTPFVTSGDIVPVNISKDGTAAYFVSPSVLTEAPNSTGDKAVKGGENLYLSREGAISFVGTVTERDVVGENIPGEGLIDGLGLWTTAVSPDGGLGIDPSRTTLDGSVLLFQSRADLTGYDSQGRTEIYRYDSADNVLSCLSCNPTKAAATGNATLQPIKQRQEKEARNSFILVDNLRPDGRRAFFQSSDALVARDTDHLQDVYEWEDEGIGTCQRSGGCVSLISSGQSQRSNSIHAVSESGDDVFFVSSDLLLGVDSDETPSIYDARVGGGFPEPTQSLCEGEGCRGGLMPPPLLPVPSTPTLPEGNKPAPIKHCPKGKRRVKRHGKVRCVKRHHRKAGAKKKGAGR